MPENKNQELYFATVIFMLLTIHFFGNTLSYYDLANEIEENCGWRCTSLEEELISENETSGFNSFITSVIMAGLALFFWPKKTYEERKQIQILREQMVAERAQKEDWLRRKEEKWKKEEKIKEKKIFTQAFISGDLSNIERSKKKKYQRFVKWAQNKEELVSQKREFIIKKVNKNMATHLNTMKASRGADSEE